MVFSYGSAVGWRAGRRLTVRGSARGLVPRIGARITHRSAAQHRHHRNQVAAFADQMGLTAVERLVNLAPLCRHHHRAKTFASWTYQQLFPGAFLWESPHGYHYLTYAGRTIDLN